MSSLKEIIRSENIGITIMGIPDIHNYKNAIYVPKLKNFDDNQGVYTQTGFLIQEAALYSHNPPRLKGHSQYIKIDPVGNYPEIERAIYVGHADLHFGHTITEFFNRLWSLRYTRKNDEKVLIHSFHSFSDLFSVGWFCDFINLLGLKKEDFILSDVPIRVSNLTVPSPAFCEESFVFSEFNSYAQDIGRIVINREASSFPELIYLSREKIKIGSWKIINESFISRNLAKLGFRIVYPEEMSLHDQIKVFSPGNIVVGPLGSAFHTSIFGRRAKLFVLSAGPPSANFFLMDYFGANDVQYFNFDVSKVSDQDGFFSCFQINNPGELANDIYEISMKYLKSSIVYSVI